MSDNVMDVRQLLVHVTSGDLSSLYRIISGPKRRVGGEEVIKEEDDSNATLDTYNALIRKYIVAMNKALDILQESGYDYDEDAQSVIAGWKLFVKNYRYRTLDDAKQYIMQREARVLKAGQIVYHGSNGEFTKESFEQDHLNQDVTFFTTDEFFASQYGRNMYVFRVERDITVYYMSMADRIVFYGFDFIALPRFEDWKNGSTFPDTDALTLEEWAVETRKLPSYFEMRNEIGRWAEYGAHTLIREAGVDGIWSDLPNDDGVDEYALTPQALRHLSMITHKLSR